MQCTSANNPESTPHGEYEAVFLNPGHRREFRSDCEQQIKGFPKARFKKFSTEAEADAFVKYGTANPTTAAIAAKNAASSTSQTIPLGVDKTTYMTRKLGKQNAGDVVDESEWEIVYTDGACQGNGKVGAIAGIGVWWGQNDPR